MEGDEGVDVLRDVEIGVPGEVLGADDVATDLKLDTTVPHETGVDLPHVPTGLAGDREGDDLVLGVAVVEVDVTVQPVLEHPELGTDLVGGGDGGLQVRVDLGRGDTHRGDGVVVPGADAVDIGRGVGAHRGSDLGGAGAQLPEVKPWGLDELVQHDGHGGTAVEVVVL